MKGIIMAGGWGSRLRPLTCDLPKPMVPIMNRPVMQYSIDLLKKHGIMDIGVTLQYLPKSIENYFGDGKDRGVNLHYYIEETPLGTAGSVKNAQELLDETFIVISGDALTNIDLTKAIDFHKKKKSIATLILKPVEVPLEYGVVVTDGQGSITRFLEKPGWGEVFSDTVNTGIYILEPQVLDKFEPGIKFDFSKDLFPMLLNERIPMYGYVTHEYWCDIGDIGSYLQAHFDIMDGSAGIVLDIKNTNENLWIEKEVKIHPTATIQGPCYIGKNTTIEEGVEILPFTVIGDNNCIGPYSSIKKSVLWDNNTIARVAELRGTILCDNIRINDNVNIFEGSAIGSNTSIQDNVTIKPDVKIWPCKSIEGGISVKDNVIWGTRLRKTLFGKDGISGDFDSEINPWFLCRLAGAYSSQLKEGSKIGVSSDHHNSSMMLKHALIAGALAAGLEVIDLDLILTPIMRYAVGYLALDGGIHITCKDDNPHKVHIHLMDEKGANLSESDERKIENIFISGDSASKIPEKIKKASIIRDMAIFYARNLINSIDKDSIQERAYKIVFSTPSTYITSFLKNIAGELDCVIEKSKGKISDVMAMGNYDLGLHIDSHGESIELYDESGVPIAKDTMMGLIGLICFKQDKDIDLVVPHTASTIMERMATTYDSNVIRTKTKKRAIMEEILKRGESSKRNTLDRFSLYFDGLAVAIGVIDLMAREQQKLSSLIEQIPKTYMSTRNVECPWGNKGRVMRTLIEEETKGNNRIELFEGIKVNKEEGWALIVPDSDEPLCTIYSEGMSEEYAEELTDFYEKKIKQIKE